ncbi:MAG: hypothetical protein ACI4PU_01415 [Intestinibacter sp.]
MKKLTPIKLVVRDSVLAFLISYGAMIVCFGGVGLSFTKEISFIVAALAPTVVVAAISKETRMPSAKKGVEEQDRYKFKTLA